MINVNLSILTILQLNRYTILQWITDNREKCYKKVDELRTAIKNATINFLQINTQLDEIESSKKP